LSVWNEVARKEAALRILSGPFLVNPMTVRRRSEYFGTFQKTPQQSDRIQGLQQTMPSGIVSLELSTHEVPSNQRCTGRDIRDRLGMHDRRSHRVLWPGFSVAAPTKH
jgi:hypothetical protein